MRISDWSSDVCSSDLGVCLFTEPAEQPKLINSINRWLEEREFGPLVDVAHHGGGNKHPEWREYSCGYNYFVEAREFAEFVLGLDWEYPDGMLLVTSEQDRKSTRLNFSH